MINGEQTFSTLPRTRPLLVWRQLIVLGAGRIRGVDLSVSIRSGLVRHTKSCKTRVLTVVLTI